MQIKFQTGNVLVPILSTNKSYEVDKILPVENNTLPMFLLLPENGNIA